MTSINELMQIIFIYFSGIPKYPKQTFSNTVFSPGSWEGQGAFRQNLNLA